MMGDKLILPSASGSIRGDGARCCDVLAVVAVVAAVVVAAAVGREGSTGLMSASSESSSPGESRLDTFKLVVYLGER